MFQNIITQQGIVKEDLLSCGPSHLQENLNYNLSVVAKKQLTMSNDLSLVQEERRLCEEECICQPDNIVINNASIIKKYWLEQKVRLLHHLVCSWDNDHIENVWGLIVANVYEEGPQYSVISELKNVILDA